MVLIINTGKVRRERGQGKIIFFPVQRLLYILITLLVIIRTVISTPNAIRVSFRQVFEGHSHYVMMVRFNLKDSNTFASASLDRQASVTTLRTHSSSFG